MELKREIAAIVQRTFPLKVYYFTVTKARTGQHAMQYAEVVFGLCLSNLKRKKNPSHCQYY